MFDNVNLTKAYTLEDLDTVSTVATLLHSK